MPTANLSGLLRTLKRGMAAETWRDRPDRQLVESYLAHRDDAVFEALMRRHGPMVYRVCWRVLQHCLDSEDAFQATFLVLAQRLRSVRNRDSLASWLHGVAYRTALKAKGQAALRQRHQRRAAVSESAPPDDLTWKELRTVLDAELARLSERLRVPLILCYLEARTQEEAASLLGWSKSTLIRRLDEARAALGRRLTRRGVVWSAAASAVLLSDCVASAALPPGLVASTVDAATLVTAGSTATAVVSAKVAALTEGVLKTMFMIKFKLAVALVAIGLFAVATLRFGINPFTDSSLAAQGGAEDTNSNSPAFNGEEKPKTDQERLQGTWEFVSLTFEGKNVWVAEAAPKSLTFSGDQVSFVGMNSNGTEAKSTSRFHLDPMKKPKEIDMTTLDGGPNRKSEGVYELDGDTLKLCLPGEPGLPNGERPKSVESKAGSGSHLWTLKRLTPASELEKLQGRWIAVAAESGGQPVPEEKLKQSKIVLVVSGEKFSTTAVNHPMRDGVIKMEGIIKLDPAKQPRQFDLTRTVVELEKGERIKSADDHGIYDLSGDTLKVCYASERPTEFKSKPNTRQKLYVFQREKAAEPQKEKTPAPPGK